MFWRARPSADCTPWVLRCSNFLFAPPQVLLVRGSTYLEEHRRMVGQAAKIGFVDQARGVAILLVVAVHLSQNFSAGIIRNIGDAGQFGVQLFFLASAFTLCLSHDRRIVSGDVLANFYIRRFFRIAPMYYVGIVLYGVGSVLLGDAQNYNLKNILANVFFVHGFILSANNTVVPGGWSIGVEMAFYAVFPGVYLAVEKVWRRWGLMGLGLALGVVLAGVVAIQVANHTLRGAWISNNSFAYYFFITQLPVFVLGVAYYLAAYRDGLWRSHPWRDGGVVVIVVGVATAIINFPQVRLLHLRHLSLVLALCSFFNFFEGRSWAVFQPESWSGLVGLVLVSMLCTS